MWVCKNCKHENKEYDRSCSRYIAMTSILSAILMPTLTLLGLYEWPPTIMIGGVIYLIYFMCFINGDSMKTHEMLATLSSVILSIALAYLVVESKEYVNINLITVLSAIIAISSLPALLIYFNHEGKKEKIALQKAIDEGRKETELQRKKEEQRKRAEIKKYGHPTKVINSAGRGPYSPQVRVFGKTEFIEISGSKIKFEDIAEYGVHEDITTNLYMSKPSMYGRGIAGGLLFGRVGALVGVLTAKQYEETKIVYTVHIWLKNGSQRHVRTSDTYYLDELCGVLESIICQNMNRI